MKAFAALFTMILMAVPAFAGSIDIGAAEKPQAVMKLDIRPVSGGCDKNCWQEAKVIKLYVMTIDQAFPPLLNIATYSWDKPIPTGIHTVNLIKIGDTAEKWRFIGINKEYQ